MPPRFPTTKEVSIANTKVLKSRQANPETVTPSPLSIEDIEQAKTLHSIALKPFEYPDVHPNAPANGGPRRLEERPEGWVINRPAPWRLQEEPYLLDGEEHTLGYRCRQFEPLDDNRFDLLDKAYFIRPEGWLDKPVIVEVGMLHNKTGSETVFEMARLTQDAIMWAETVGANKVSWRQVNASVEEDQPILKVIHDTLFFINAESSQPPQTNDPLEYASYFSFEELERKAGV